MVRLSLQEPVAAGNGGDRFESQPAENFSRLTKIPWGGVRFPRIACIMDGMTDQMTHPMSKYFGEASEQHVKEVLAAYREKNSTGLMPDYLPLMACRYEIWVEKTDNPGVVKGVLVAAGNANEAREALVELAVQLELKTLLAGDERVASIVAFADANVAQLSAKKLDEAGIQQLTDEIEAAFASGEISRRTAFEHEAIIHAEAIICIALHRDGNSAESYVFYRSDEARLLTEEETAEYIRPSDSMNDGRVMDALRRAWAQIDHVDAWFAAGCPEPTNPNNN